MQKIILPKHLRDSKPTEILEFLANKVHYHYGMGDDYRRARQAYESGKNYCFEDDIEYEELFKRPDVK